MAISLRAQNRPALRRTPLAPLPPLPQAACAALPPRALAFAFQRRRDGFTLDVAWQTRARRLGILGASGSGKSATLRLIAGLDRADHAALSFDGHSIALPPYQRGIAYVPQTYGLLPHLPVAAQIRFGAGCDPARAAHWTRLLGLGDLEHRLPGELSLGQQQRVALARALARPSGLLLLDEPFSALDAPLRTRLRAELLALQGGIDTTTILVTHDPVEAMLLADELLLLEDGRVLQSGPVETVFQRPASEAAARLLGADNVAAGIAAGHAIDVGGACLAVGGPPLPSGAIGWAVRPSSIRIGPDQPYAAVVVQQGDVRAGERRLTVRIGNALLHVVAAPGCCPGLGPCRIGIDPAAIQVWPA